MPGLARMGALGVLHRVMTSGIERRANFRDNQDRNELLNQLEALLPETRTAGYAWALIPNHAHSLFRTGRTPLSSLQS